MTSSSLTHFVQACPICGRRLQVRMSLLGRSVACPHCQAEFTASLESEPGASANDLLARAEMLLAQNRQAASSQRMIDAAP